MAVEYPGDILILKLIQSEIRDAVGGLYRPPTKPLQAKDFRELLSSLKK